MTFKLGLTGSIGMGKSTTAEMFVAEGCALWDADAAVHRLYAKGGAAVAPMSAAFPDCIEDGMVSRERLKELISQDATVLNRIEVIVHPLVAKDRTAFLESSQADITVLDIPLLFEGGSAAFMDAIVVVSVDFEEQKKRLMQRARMTREQLKAIMEKQAPDAEKRAKADYIIETDTLDHAREQVQAVVRDIRAGLAIA
ncbi:MAG: dephospho-CoA kinase [Roseovarius sp.]|nr:dephospho-CoA kinase [Roseovarius sp.]